MTPTGDGERVSDARGAAVRAVTDALDGRRFVSETLRELRAGGRLEGREAALAMEISQGAVRHFVTIEHVLGAAATYHRHRTASVARAILCTAAYQLIWMDRIPVFAAVDRAVDSAHALVGGRCPAMVNAVLRRLAAAIAERSGTWQRLDPTRVRTSWNRACAFRQRILPAPRDVETSGEYLAAATGERLARYRTLCERHGDDAAEGIAWASQAVPAIVLQRNTLRTTADGFARQLCDSFGDAAEVHEDVAFLPSAAAVIETPVFREGGCFVQDTAAHAAAVAVGARPGERILDLCAAPGGKTMALALAMQDQGSVVACDTDAERLARVVANVSRLGLTCVHTRLLKEGAAALDEPVGFDGVLVDVPCSNTGVIARRPEARLGLTARKLRSLNETQAELLRAAGQCVRPGGRLVYSTCSLEPDENERMVSAFLAERADWRQEVEQTALPAWGARCADWRDGGYFARLLRVEGG